jgi:hypothetical protein
MEKLFAALRERHPGYEPVDVRFLVNQMEVNGRSASALDEELAKAVASAEVVPIETVRF